MNSTPYRDRQKEGKEKMVDEDFEASLKEALTENMNRDRTMALNPEKAIALKTVCRNFSEIVSENGADYNVESKIVIDGTVARINITFDAISADFENAAKFKEAIALVDSVRINIYKGKVAMIMYITDLFIEIE